MVKKNEAQSGDRVEIHLSKEIYEGFLLESEDSGIVMIKLDNGYNIGFNKSEVLKIELIKKSKDKKEKFEMKIDENKPNIGMIITGGTIAARLNSKKGGVDWLDTPESLFKYYPGIFQIVNVSEVVVPFMKASEDMDYRDWQKIARVVKDMVNKKSIKGVIVTHGTDFLHYTSSALSFFLKDLGKPVVLTYSQRSIDRASSDANLNLICAGLIAISDLAGVMLVGHADSCDEFCLAMRGTKVKKMHTSRRDAFKQINVRPVARIYPDVLFPEKIKIDTPIGVRNEKLKTSCDFEFEEKVALVKVYPGQSPLILDYYLEQGYKGIVLEVSGLGHLPTMRSRDGWNKKLKEVIDKGLIVCASAQTVYGKLNPLVYSNGREIVKTGVIFLEDMLSETALVKLGWVLGHKEWDKEKIKDVMIENIAGELNNKIGFEK